MAATRRVDAASDQIVAPYLAFAVARITARAAGSDEHRRSAAGKEIGGVIQPGTVGGRRLAGILGGAKNYDHIGWVGFIRSGLALDAGANGQHVCHQPKQNEAGEDCEQSLKRRAH